MNEYFSQTKFISNSDLSTLQRIMRLQDADLKCVKALAFGNLVDAKFTEPEKFADIDADADDLSLAEKMYEAGLQDSALKLYFDRAKMQHEIYRQRFPIEHEGNLIEIPARGKLDFILKPLRSGADLKTTACSSRASFIRSIFNLGYDRAAAWYMDLGALDSFMIIGISKKINRITRKHDIYKFAIKRGDDVYLNAKAKYSRLAFLHYYLIYNFPI